MFKLRYVIAICISAFVTTALFLGMRFLVASDEEAIIGPTSSNPITIRREFDDTKTKTKKRTPKPDKPVLAKAPPPPPVMDVKTTIDDVDSVGSGIGLPLEPNIGADPNANRSAVALIQVPPVYPERCARKGIEGWVLVEFDINPAGLVENAEVVDSEPKGCFERSSLKAIRGWKFKARMQDGKPVHQYRMQELIQFEIDDTA